MVLTATPLNYFLTQSAIWGSCYFFLSVYFLLWAAILFYLVPNLTRFTASSTFKSKMSFTYITGTSNIVFVVTPILLLLLLLISWSGSSILAWYGHIVFANWQYRITYIVIFNFLFLVFSYLTSVYFTSNDIYDYLIVIYNFFFWITYLFASNNMFTFIFFIEVISTLIILMLTTSTFSSTYLYNTRNLRKHSYFQTTTPLTFFKTILFFFWVSLVGSLNLFVFTIVFYLKVLTFDWFLAESVLVYVLYIGNFKSLFALILAWFIIIFSVFLKCGLVPFYFWKPSFFKGMSFHSLFFYIFFFYFFLLLFLIHFFIVYMGELFFLSTAVNLSLLMVGMVSIIFLLFESYYIKAFLALSSILNTLLLFLGMTSFHVVDLMFIL